MRSVFKREFSSAFHHICSYIAVALSLLISAIVLSANNLTYAQESVGTMVSFMALVTILIIPVIAASVVPSRKSSGKDSVYSALPLRSRDVAVGKYLAALCVTLISDAFVLLSPVISGFFGTVDHLMSYTAILGYVLFQAAWLAVCVFIFKAVTRRVAAYITVYATALIMALISVFIFFVPVNAIVSLICLCVLAALIGAVVGLCTKRISVGVIFGVALVAFAAVAYIVTPESFAGLFETVIGLISPVDRFNPFIYGIFDIGAIVYYLSLTAAFLWLFGRKFAMDHEKRERKPSMNLKKVTSAATALLLVTVLCGINVAAAAVPRRFNALDASMTDKASVSKEAKEYLATVDKDVTFYLLEPVARDMDYSVDAETYRLYLDRLIATNGHFELVEVYYEDTPEFYTDRGISYENITPNSLLIECGDRMEYVSFYSLLYYSNSDMGSTQMSLSEYLYAVQLYSSSEQYAEYLYSLLYNTTVYNYADLSICSVVEYVTADIIPNNYYLTGHGEPSTEDITSAFYEWDLPLLDTTAEEIPEDAASILINMPSEDISEAERDAFLEYLSGGGQLTFVTNESNLDMPNLCAVLKAYGMSVENRDFVKEPVEEDEESEETAEKATTEFYPTVKFDNDILGEISDTTAVTPTVKNANAITVDEDARENLLIKPLLTSSTESYIGDDPEQRGSYTLACAAETPDGAKVVWFTGGESFNGAASVAANVLAYALTWVTMEYTSVVSNIPPTLYEQPMTVVSSGGATMITVILCLVAVGVAVFGVVNLYRRKKAK